MADEKPKHKPQQKRTLDEVLKSLQDLIRNDLISAKPSRQSWRESGREDEVPETPTSEPDTFHKALFKLDQIISEKVIEPVERAKQEPPEPLLPDEEIEIEWDIDEKLPKDAAESAPTGIAVEDLEALDRATASLDTIEIPAPEQPRVESITVEESRAAAPPEPQPEMEPSLDVVAQPIEPVSIEVIEAAPVRESEEAKEESIDVELVTAAEAPVAEEPVDFALQPEPAEPPDPQQMFDFNTLAPPQETAAPVAAPPASSPGETPTIGAESSELRESAEVTATVAPAEEQPESPPSSEELMIVDLSDDTGLEAVKTKEVPAEQPESHTVELSSAGAVDAFTLEFKVEPKASRSAQPRPTDAKAEFGTTSGDTLIHTDAKQPSEDLAVKERIPPPGTEESPRKVSEQAEETPTPPESADSPEEIPVLSEVADISAPPSPPLPNATQARDIAIRVIARLNIERRKSGEKPLDIKTIERMQQYLADALSKRALNKPK